MKFQEGFNEQLIGGLVIRYQERNNGKGRMLNTKYIIYQAKIQEITKHT